jgi:hypothetical protein
MPFSAGILDLTVVKTKLKIESSGVLLFERQIIERNSQVMTRFYLRWVTRVLLTKQARLWVKEFKRARTRTSSRSPEIGWFTRNRR